MRGTEATRVAVTHPAGWGPHKVESLRTALTAHAVESALLLSEPQAAAVGYAAAERVEPGAVVAVYDFGGGTFDAAVVRKAAGGVLELLGTPQGLERLGGLDLDEAVFEHVRAAIGPAWEALDPADPAVFAAFAGLRRECTSAKEALSHDTEVLVPVRLPGAHTQVRLGRVEFEETIRPAVLETVDAMRRAIDSAVVVPPDLTALLLVGGSSRIPRVAQLVSTGIGRSVPVDVRSEGCDRRRCRADRARGSGCGRSSSADRGRPAFPVAFLPRPRHRSRRPVPGRRRRRRRRRPRRRR
ncbi:MAG: Hsp70 family protein, partial [Pseudonocardia sp.]|nr:Hsp70 family protein [Pseudonocardia sp.]